MNLLSAGVGLRAFTVSDTASRALAVGGFIGLIIVAMVTMFAGGFTTGCLARGSGSKQLGGLYGFITWTVALLVAIVLMAPIGNVVSQSTQAINPSTINWNLNSTQASSLTALASQPIKRSSNASTAQPVSINPKAASRQSSRVAFLTFILFFIGALSSWVGGRRGMNGCGAEREK